MFQVLLLDSENTGQATGSLRDARDLVITDEQFRAFLDRHKNQRCLVPESNEVMRDSYLNLDEEMRYVLVGSYYITNSNLLADMHTHSVPRFLNCTNGGKKPGHSLLDVGVEEAMRDAGFNNQAFLDRGGVFEWSRVNNNFSREDETLDW